IAPAPFAALAIFPPPATTFASGFTLPAHLMTAPRPPLPIVRASDVAAILFSVLVARLLSSTRISPATGSIGSAARAYGAIGSGSRVRAPTNDVFGADRRS